MAIVAPRHETSQLTFLKWDPLYEREKPFVYLSEVPKHSEDQRQSNFVFHSVDIPITDVRGSEQKYGLDEHGFAYRKNKLQFSHFNDGEAIERDYLPAVEKFLLAEVEDADEVCIFDWRVCTLCFEMGYLAH